MSTNENSPSGENDSEPGILDEILEQSTSSGAENPDVHSVLDPSQEVPERRVEISTKEALKYLRDAPGVEARRKDRKWILSVGWEGEEVFTYETKDFNEAHRVMEHRAVPIAECLELLGRASEQVEDYTVRSLWPAVSEYAASESRRETGGSWVFVCERTQELLHIISGNRSLGDAINHFRENVQHEGPIEIWDAEPQWRRKAAYHGDRNPQVGDSLDEISTLAMDKVLNRELAEETPLEDESAEDVSTEEDTD